MTYRIAVILALLSQAPKPLPSPKPAATPVAQTVPLVMDMDNGRTVLTVKDADIPGGPCDFGKLVRLARAHLAAEYAWARAMMEQSRGNPKPLLDAQPKMLKSIDSLRAELDHCEPKPKG